MRPTRRHLLLGAAGFAGLAGLGRVGRALADPGRGGPAFVFVHAPGGWDPTRVFAPAFGRAEVDMEPGAEALTVGGLRIVDHPSRPSVRAFFERHHGRCMILNGLTVPSIDHATCTRLLLTGEARDGRPDWAARLAHHLGDDVALPHLVLGGPAFPGPYADAVVRAGANGQLDAVLTAEVVNVSAMPTSPLSDRAAALVDRFLSGRGPARELAATSDAEAEALAAWRRAHERALALEDLRRSVTFATSPDLVAQVDVAVDALAAGLCRCVTLAFSGIGGLGWDSHTDNDTTQARLFEALFAGLGALMDRLGRVRGRTAATLADETVVVVLSEMGRTPRLNATLGKDHWPATSALLLGPGLTTDRVVGGFDRLFGGFALDPRSGEPREGGQVPNPRHLGATLARLAGLDAGALVPGVPVLEGLLDG